MSPKNWSSYTSCPNKWGGVVSRVIHMKRPEAEENYGAMTSYIGEALIIKKNLCLRKYKYS